MSTADPLAVVQEYIDGFNSGDVEGLAAAFADSAAILDGMAPRLWQGPAATRDWYRGVLVEGERHGASGYFATTGEPVHNNVTGTFMVKGNQMTQTGAFFTVALRRQTEGWPIAGTKGG